MKDTAEYAKAALFEHRFWLQILGDHARFIYQSLPRSDTEDAGRAVYFIQAFDQLRNRSRQDLTGPELASLNAQAYRYAQEIRDFKLHIIRQSLLGGIHLPATFGNHMVNEVEEYLHILGHLVTGEVPPQLPPIHHHLLWLSDTAVHANGISGFLDIVEKGMKQKSEQFVNHFEALYLQAIELAGFMRANLHRFPALTRFNRQAELEMALFNHFLGELMELELNAQLLGSLSPLIVDHFAREACYYLTKLSEVSEVQKPDCDPAHPRPSS